MTIFIVEDDISLQKLYEIILESSGFQIIGIANNGNKAVNMYNSFSEKPEIILMIIESISLSNTKILSNFKKKLAKKKVYTAQYAIDLIIFSIKFKK